MAGQVQIIGSRPPGVRILSRGLSQAVCVSWESAGPASSQWVCHPASPPVDLHLSALGRSTPRASTGILVETGCAWGHGGPWEHNTSVSDQTWSVHPAAMAGVPGRHPWAAPGPGVGSGRGNAWRKLAWGQTPWWDVGPNTRCSRMPSVPWQSVLPRRPSAATRWRRVRCRRSPNAGWIVQPQRASV